MVSDQSEDRIEYCMPRIWKVVEFVGEFRFMWSFTCVCDVCTWMTTWKGVWSDFVFVLFWSLWLPDRRKVFFSDRETSKSLAKRSEFWSTMTRRISKTQFGSPWWNRFPNPLLFFPSEDLCQRPFTNREVHPPIAWLERHRKSMLFFWVFLLNRACARRFNQKRTFPQCILSPNWNWFPLIIGPFFGAIQNKEKIEERMRW